MPAGGSVALHKSCDLIDRMNQPSGVGLGSETDHRADPAPSGGRQIFALFAVPANVVEPLSGECRISTRLRHFCASDPMTG